MQSLVLREVRCETQSLCGGATHSFVAGWRFGEHRAIQKPVPQVAHGPVNQQTVQAESQASAVKRWQRMGNGLSDVEAQPAEAGC